MPRLPLGFSALLLVTAAAGCGSSDDGTGTPDRRTPTSPAFTASSGSVSTLLGRSTFPGDFKVKRKTDALDLEIKSRSPLDIAVQSIAFPAGSHSGWHKHPGPVFIQVVSGAMTFYEGDDPSCTGVVRTAGQGYLDSGDHPHIARNESGAPATNVVTYFAPPGATLRIDTPNPGNCPF